MVVSEIRAPFLSGFSLTVHRRRTQYALSFSGKRRMNLKKVLSKESILPALQADTKANVLEELIDFMAKTGKISDRDAALQAVLARKAKMSTGMQNGIAIPHGKTDSVDQLVVVIAIKPDGVDFDAMDDNPCSIFIMTLSPIKRRGPHMQFLAEISRLIGKASVREKLRQCKTNNGIYELLTEK